MTNSWESFVDSTVPSTAPGTAASSTEPKETRKNGLAISALVLGIVALVGAFIPFFNFVTGIIALVGVTLGIVAMFQKCASKPLSITAASINFIAIILSIVMVTAYTSIFMAVLKDKFPDALANIQSGATGAPAADAEVVTRVKFDEAIAYPDGLSYSISTPVAFQPDPSATKTKQAANVVFTITVINGTKSAFKPVFTEKVTSGGTKGDSIVDTALGGGLTAAIPAGGTASYKAGYSIADATQVIFDITPGSRYAHTIFEW